MKSGSGAIMLAGLGVTAAIVGGLFWWDRERKSERAKMAQDNPIADPVGMFPDLRVGDAVLIDPVKAQLPAPFASSPTPLLAVVDMVLMDPLLVSVRVGVRDIPPTFSGTISRAAIIRQIPRPPGIAVA